MESPLMRETIQDVKAKVVFVSPQQNCILLITYLFNPEYRKETFGHFT
jgi:hypothetical protein